MSDDNGMRLTFKIWRQRGPNAKGRLETYPLSGISPNISFIEALEAVNRMLMGRGEEPVAFEFDCREGICGTCGLVINGQAHGPLKGVTTCELHMRHFRDGDTIVVEPWRARAFPVIKDLVVDRSAFDRIMQAGGYVSVNTGAATEANSILVGKDVAEKAMDAASCIGCGACVATCKNASAMLFVAAKVSQLALMPQGAPERRRRALAMVGAMDDAGFGNCTNESECQAACPKEISVINIQRLNREYLKAALVGVE